MHLADTTFFRFRSRTSHLAARRRSLLRPTLSWLTFCRTPLRRKRKASPASLDCGGPLKRICPSPRCSPPTAPPSPLKAPRGAQATSPHWRPLKIRDTPGFLPAGLLQVAGSVHAVRDAQHFPCISISFPCLYGLIRSYLHARGHCELSSTSAKCISLPSGGRSERGPRVGIPLKLFHSHTSVCLPSHLVDAYLSGWSAREGRLVVSGQASTSPGTLTAWSWERFIWLSFTFFHSWRTLMSSSGWTTWQWCFTSIVRGVPGCGP